LNIKGNHEKRGVKDVTALSLIFININLFSTQNNELKSSDNSVAIVARSQTESMSNWDSIPCWRKRFLSYPERPKQF
jgi:hypothetical protein